MKMKNPFKKAGIVTTVTNVAVGGAANVAVDYAVSQISQLASVDAMYINGGKIVAGALLGSMSKNQYLHAAADGIAVVGASNLISSLISTTSNSEGQAGVPRGTVGRVRPGDKYFQRNAAKRASKGFTVSGAFVGK